MPGLVASGTHCISAVSRVISLGALTRVGIMTKKCISMTI